MKKYTKLQKLAFIQNGLEVAFIYKSLRDKISNDDLANLMITQCKTNYIFNDLGQSETCLNYYKEQLEFNELPDSSSGSFLTALTDFDNVSGALCLENDTVEEQSVMERYFYLCFEEL